MDRFGFHADGRMDVKNVFQIVPWKERAFNSHLLIAQVLGRGLRVPEAYLSPQPKVTVFNHSAWSGKIKNLVEEVLEIEARIYSQPLLEGARSQYHFSLHISIILRFRRKKKKSFRMRAWISQTYAGRCRVGIAVSGRRAGDCL